jgi:hypothetical protein
MEALNLCFLVGILGRIGSRTDALSRPAAEPSALHADVNGHPGGRNQQTREGDEKDNQ